MTALIHRALRRFRKPAPVVITPPTPRQVPDDGSRVHLMQIGSGSVAKFVQITRTQEAGNGRG